MTDTDTAYEHVAQLLDRCAADRAAGSHDTWGQACIAIDHPQDPKNIGSALRAAGCFGVSLIAIAGAHYRKASTDVGHQYRRTPLLEVDDLRLTVPYHFVPVAVELVEDAVPLPEYEHPELAYYVFGGEHMTLGRRTLSWCRDTIYIPTRASLNLAACINVVLYDRLTKCSRGQQAWLAPKPGRGKDIPPSD
ncbi:MAG TPA: TrmH family RNA methyltransferase [Candidatus Ozemobacteraceae bacterium]|nr:TrmH family RNA methyltransferase [Candidatus Ozemobacteraceae bacterium]